MATPTKANGPEGAGARASTRTLAMVAGFDAGPFLEPRHVLDLDEMLETFGDDARDSISATHLRMWQASGEGGAVIVRGGTSPELSSAEVIIGISALAASRVHWDLLCLSSFIHFDDFEFEVITSHAHAVCDRLRTDVQIVDPRWRALR